MSRERSASKGWRIAGAGWIAVSLIACPCSALAQSQEMPPIPTPFPTPDFHYSDSTRDAEYWRLQVQVTRAHTAFYRSIDAARRALFRDDARLITPVRLGTPAWLQARAAAERAIRAGRPVRDALNALVDFIARERPRVSPAETERAIEMYRAQRDNLHATSDMLIDLLASLAGIRMSQ